MDAKDRKKTLEFRGRAKDCKSVYSGSFPAVASNLSGLD
jgi:hypothetical protein